MKSFFLWAFFAGNFSSWKLFDGQVSSRADSSGQSRDRITGQYRPQAYTGDPVDAFSRKTAACCSELFRGLLVFSFVNYQLTRLFLSQSTRHPHSNFSILVPRPVRGYTAQPGQDRREELPSRYRRY